MDDASPNSGDMSARSSAKPAQPVVDAGLDDEAGDEVAPRAHVSLSGDAARAFVDEAILGKTKRPMTPELRRLVERVKRFRDAR